MSDENPYGGTGEPPEEQRPASPSPYQGNAMPPPGNYPAGPPGAPQQRSDRWKIWLGIGLTIPVLIATAVLAGLVSVVDDTGALTGITSLAGLVVPVVLLFIPATRKLALGLLIGYAVLFVVVAGLCVAIIASYS